MRYSKQRELIYDCVRNKLNHPSAEDVYMYLKKDNPRISLGTVYRNLNYLCQENKIRKIASKLDNDHYDAITTNHFHLICQNCHCLEDVDDKTVKDIEMIINSNEDFKVVSFDLNFYGLCKKCKEKGDN